MNQVVFAAEQTRGRRSSLTEQTRVETLTTAGGFTLTVAVAADGKSGYQGQRAAELTVEIIFETIQLSPARKSSVIPPLLRKALVSANNLVYAKAHEERWSQTMGTTVTVVAVHAQKLYLAHVGDCRAYLVRNGQAIQLTRDHTWAYEMIRQGHMSEAEAMVHPKADILMRAIGNEANVTIDLGLHLSEAESEEEAYYNQGYSLQPMDRVLICTDGLIKSRNVGSSLYVSLAEIVKLMTSKGAEKAALALVERALTQEVKDNFSVIVLEVSAGKAKPSIPRLEINIPKALSDFTWPACPEVPWSGRYVVAGIAGVILIILVLLVVRSLGSDQKMEVVTDRPIAAGPTAVSGGEPSLLDEETPPSLSDNNRTRQNTRLILPGLSNAWRLIVAAAMMMAAAVMLRTVLKVMS